MFKNLSLPVIISVGVLCSLNLIMVSSLSPHLLSKQIIAWTVGVTLFFVGRQINPKETSSSKNIIFIGSCFLLLLPILLNNITRGSRRWIEIGPLTLQPSEAVKPWLMIFLSTARYPLLHLIPVGIIMLQPDLGSALTVLILLAPIALTHRSFLKLGTVAFFVLIIITPVVWQKVLHDYQKNRILTFLNPDSDPLGKGYNTIQSKIAIGSGGLFGKGYRQGSQGQLLFLPEKHTDFIFAATSEELGLVSSGIIIFSYYLLIKSLITKAFVLHDKSLSIFTLGIAIQIWFQAFVNIGMNIGLLPVTGIPLPFLSVGGSSLISLLFSLGIIFSP